MDIETNQVTAGAFVIALLLITIIVIAWLSSGFSFKSYTIYEVTMQESVSGLNVDATVEFNGVNVGKVKQVLLSHKNPRLVELLLALRDGTPVTQGTRAMLNVRGLTGISYISLKDKGENVAPLTKDRNQKWPIIPTEPSLFLQLNEALAKLNQNVSAATDSIRSLLSDKNIQEVSNILSSMNSLSILLLKDHQRVNEILNNTIKLSNEFPTTITNLNNTLNNLSIVSDEIRNNPALLIRGKSSQPLGPGES